MRTNQWLPKIFAIKTMGHRMVYPEFSKDEIRNADWCPARLGEPDHRVQFIQKRKFDLSEVWRWGGMLGRAVQ